MTLNKLIPFPTVFKAAAFRRLAQIFDDIAHAICIIDYAHHEVHEGDAFHIDVSSANLGSVTGDHLQITLTTPAVADPQKRVHMVADAYGSGEILFSIQEAPIGGNSGTTAIAAMNKNRGSSNTTSCTAVYEATTLGTGGTLIADHYVGAGRDKVGGASRARTEWVLKPATTYTFRVYAAAAITAYLALDWYEHTDSQW